MRYDIIFASKVTMSYRVVLEATTVKQHPDKQSILLQGSSLPLKLILSCSIGAHNTSSCIVKILTSAHLCFRSIGNDHGLQTTLNPVMLCHMLLDTFNIWFTQRPEIFLPMLADPLRRFPLAPPYTRGFDSEAFFCSSMLLLTDLSSCSLAGSTSSATDGLP